MARGGLSYAGIGARNATFKAGAGIQALVDAADRDAVVGLAVVLSGENEVDLGSDGDVIYGFIDVYEMDGHCTVQFRGFREGVPVGTVAPTAKKLAAVDGNGGVKDLPSLTVGTETVDLNGVVRGPVTVNVNAVEGTATVFLG